MNLVFPQRAGSVVNQWNGMVSLDKSVFLLPLASESKPYILSSTEIDDNFLLVSLTL